MIRSFKDKETEMLAKKQEVKGLDRRLQNQVYNHLVRIDAAETLKFLRFPQSNRLEKLHGKLKGFWSIRVNDRWRIIFRWVNKQAYDVRLIDYH